MNRKCWINHLLGAFFAFLFSVCTVGCLVTGFDLHVSRESILWIYKICGAASVISALILYIPYGGIVLPVLLLPAVKYFWNGGILWDQFKSLAFTITYHFHNVYGWNTVGEPVSADTELALLLLAGITALAVSIGLCRSLHILLFLPPVLLPLVLCLVTTDTLPEEPYLFLLIAGIVLLFLTDLVRRRDPVHGGILTLTAAVPITAALALLFLLNPQTEYVSRAGEIQKETVTWFQNTMRSVESVMNGNISGIFSNQTLNLRNVGPKNNLSFSVMRVYTPFTGTVYLRGQDYDIYTGTSWESSPERSETFTPGSENTASGSVAVITYGVREMLYVPYYSTDTITLTGGYMANWDNLNSYSFPYSRIPDVVFGSSSVDAGYTDLPEETREWAEPLLDTILKGETIPDRVIRLIQNYVQRSAVYDRSTTAMNSSSDDFAQWFLEESDTGYCVHFATATAILLRAAGIPARYVEGYMINCQSGEKNIVTNQEAHAWVEYFDPVFSVWWILDATPMNVEEISEIVFEQTDSNDNESEDNTFEYDDAAPTETEETVVHDLYEGFSGSTASGILEEEEEEEEESAVSLWDDSAETGNTVLPEEENRIPGWICVSAVLVLLLTAFPVQGYLRIQRKRRLWNTGTPNAMALSRWNQLERLAELLKIRLPRELEELALKAKFSRHVLTEEELYQFERCRQQLQPVLKRQPWYRKLLLRCIYAVI